MDALGASSSIRPTVEAATCADDGPGCAIFAYDIAATPSHATFAMGALNMPSSIYSSMDAATGCAPLVDDIAVLAPLPLTFGVTPADSWHICQRVRLFFRASLKRVPCPPMLRRT